MEEHAMRPIHIFGAILVALIWGVNFTIIRVGLGSFPPLLLVALRFVVAALPVFILPRPAVSWGRLIAIGATLFLGQYAFLFTGMSLGLPAGLASVLLQSQAFLTILMAALVLREKPTQRQIIGTVVSLLGLTTIATTVGGADFTLIGLVFCFASALSWACGNVLIRGVGKADMLAFVSWLSLLQPIPLFILSLLFEGPGAIYYAMEAMNWAGISAVIYIGLLSTTVAFAIWSRLLSLYSAANVVPFSLLVPVFGTTSAAVFLGETFNFTKLIGMGLVLFGLVIIALPWNKILRGRAFFLR